MKPKHSFTVICILNPLKRLFHFTKERWMAIQYKAEAASIEWREILIRSFHEKSNNNDSWLNSTFCLSQLCLMLRLYTYENFSSFLFFTPVIRISAYF